MKVVELNTDDCMFARLPAPTGSGRERRQELIFGFEAQLPVPIEQLQMAFAEAESGIIACACPKDVLEHHRATADRAIPASLPDWLDVSDQDSVCSQLNLLTGDMKPRSQILRRERTLKIACGLFVVIAALFSFGVSKRVEKLHAANEEVRSDIRAMYEAVLPAPQPGAAQPDSIRFATIMNQLSATRTGMVDEAGAPLIHDLADVLTAWPVESKAQVSSISVDRAEIRIEAGVPDNRLAAGLLEHFRSKKEFNLKAHQTTPSGDQINLRMQFDRPDQGDQSDEG